MKYDFFMKDRHSSAQVWRLSPSRWGLPGGPAFKYCGNGEMKIAAAFAAEMGLSFGDRLAIAKSKQEGVAAVLFLCDETSDLPPGCFTLEIVKYGHTKGSTQLCMTPRIMPKGWPLKRGRAYAAKKNGRQILILSAELAELGKNGMWRDPPAPAPTKRRSSKV